MSSFDRQWEYRELPDYLKQRYKQIWKNKQKKKNRFFLFLQWAFKQYPFWLNSPPSVFWTNVLLSTTRTENPENRELEFDEDDDDEEEDVDADIAEDVDTDEIIDDSADSEKTDNEDSDAENDLFWDDNEETEMESETRSVVGLGVNSGVTRILIIRSKWVEWIGFDI